MLIRRLPLIGLAALAAGCGSTTHTSSARIPPPAPPRWPSASDYGTIKTAVAARDDALFRQTDWRHRRFVASLALQQLMTVRVGPSACAQYVIELYGSLKALEEAYPGEDWRPLARFVRHQPSLASQCRRPSLTLTA